MNLIDEFIDAYEDDLIYILEAQKALFTHPLKFVYEKAAIASFTRVYIVTAVNEIEIIIKKWADKDYRNILSVYFSEKSTNGERVNALYSAFKKAGINVDLEIFKDYLALKYLRNTIVHGEWREGEKEWITERGFPNDVREFNEEHFNRVKEVVLNMEFYIFLAIFPTTSDKLIRLREEDKRTYKDYGILKFIDLYKIIWKNLERIDNYIYQDILNVVSSPQYYWASGLSEEEIDSMSQDEQIRLLYLAAYRAGKAEHSSLVKHRSLASDTLGFWRIYWDWTVSRGLNEDKIKQALQIIRDPNFPLEEKIWSIAGFSEKENFEKFLSEIWETLKEKIPYSREEISEAFFIGKLAYKLFPNLTPLFLFTLRLPIVDPENVNLYFQEAQRIYNALLLRFSWYECVERNERFIPKNLDLCLKICEEFLKE